MFLDPHISNLFFSSIPHILSGLGGMGHIHVVIPPLPFYFTVTILGMSTRGHNEQGTPGRLTITVILSNFYEPHKHSPLHPN